MQSPPPPSIKQFNTDQIRIINRKIEARVQRRFLKDLAMLSCMLGDLIFFTIGMMVAFYIRFDTRIANQLYRYEHNHVPSYSSYFTFGLLLFAVTAMAYGNYRHDMMMMLRRGLWKVTCTLFAWFGAYLLLTITFKMDPVLSQAFVWFCLPCCGVMLMIWRYLLHKIFSLRPIANVLRQQILVIGWNKEADRLADAVQRDPRVPFQIVGCLPSARGSFASDPLNPIEKLGEYSRLESILEGGKIDIVLVADLETQTEEMIALSQLCERKMVQFKIIPTFFQILLTALVLESVSGVPVLGVEHVPLSQMGNRMIKRSLDIVGSIVGLILFSPVLLIFGLLIRRESPGPIFFTQTRRGRYGRLFKMYKLRSMQLGAQAMDHLHQSTLRDDPRLLKIGKLMRRYNIDELPQFWNVLTGQMSLVGPRPERLTHAAQLEVSIPYYNARHNIKPGLTGWAQIHGLRGDTDLNERVRADLYYIENWNILLDFYIMGMTVLRNKNAY